MRKTCRISSGAMALATLDASGTDGTVPARALARRHAAHRELPAGTESGMLLFEKYRCDCGKELARSHEAIRGHTAHAVARVHDAAGFPHYG